MLFGIYILFFFVLKKSLECHEKVPRKSWEMPEKVWRTPWKKAKNGPPQAEKGQKFKVYSFGTREKHILNY